MSFNHPNHSLDKSWWKRNKYGVPEHLLNVQGGFKNHFVIKHYKYGVIKTKWPDMSRIISSTGQRKCRNLFKEAVAYAKTVIADPVKKAEWQKRIRRPNGVYNKAITQYMLQAKRQIEKQKEMEEINKLIRKAFKVKQSYPRTLINLEEVTTLTQTYGSLKQKPPWMH